MAGYTYAELLCAESKCQNREWVKVRDTFTVDAYIVRYEETRTTATMQKNPHFRRNILQFGIHYRMTVLN